MYTFLFTEFIWGNVSAVLYVFSSASTITGFGFTFCSVYILNIWVSIVKLSRVSTADLMAIRAYYL